VAQVAVQRSRSASQRLQLSLRALAPPRPVVRRLVSLYSGLVLFGLSVALLISARLGLDPWDVFHQGLARRTGLPIGWIVNGTGVIVLLLWIPLRQRPEIGTVSNVIIVGLVIDAALPLLPQPRALVIRAAFLSTGILANGIATGLYIGAGLGPGPRDGLMTGLAKRGWPIRRVRTVIELAVLAAGWLLGGTVGIGTLLYAVSIGPLTHVLIPKLAITEHKTEHPKNTEEITHDWRAIRAERARVRRTGLRPCGPGSQS
jgi:uncharacterized membrane protein YczE